ncbi:MAG: hypothetical protein J3K34DRAFT_458236 [Monoraphidium minutum]|nr:MAG: hypothetical protein J3K34DRAFT_458236 [Monoraphidium minutum]
MQRLRTGARGRPASAGAARGGGAPARRPLRALPLPPPRLCGRAAAAPSSAAPAAPPPAAAADDDAPGLLCVPGLASPPDLAAAWRRRWRPAVEARLAALNLAASGSDDRQLLAALDALLLPLRDASALSAHAAARAGGGAWRAAAAEVAAGCSKYEAFLASDRRLAARLKLAEQRLRQRAETRPQGDAAAARDAADAAAQAQLCAALLRALRRGAPAAAGAALDGGEWAAALEAADGSAQRVAELMEEERALLARLDRMMSDPGLSPVVELPASDIGDALGRRASALTNGSSGGGGAEGLSESGGGEGAQGSGGDEDGRALVTLTRAAAAALLARAPGAPARRAAYDAGVAPRLAAGGAALAALARVRSEAAALCGAESYPELCCRQLAAPGPLEVAQFLQAAAAALRPRADAQAAALLAKAAAANAAAAAEEGAEGADAALGGDAGAAAARLDPWDWERLVEAECAPDAATLRALSDHTRLDAALLGFSSLLHRLLAVALLPRPPAGGGAEAWAPGVRVLAVVHEARGHLGTLYIDPGGGYGTRVLRHGAWRWPARGGGGSGEGGVSAAELWAAAAALEPAAAATEAGPAAGGEAGGEAGSAAGGEVVAWLQRHAASRPAVSIGLGSAPRAPDGGGGAGAGGGALSLPALWELGHEMGHAVHLLLSSPNSSADSDSSAAAAAALAAATQPQDVPPAAAGDAAAAAAAAAAPPRSPHLSGRFLPPDLLEIPSAIIERAMLDPGALSMVCRHWQSAAPAPAELARALARRYRWRYGSPLALQDKVCASLAELLLGLFPDDPSADATWAQARAEFGSAPPWVAGTARQLALMPVVAAHRGSYFSYVTSWAWARHVWAGPAAALLRGAAAGAGAEAGPRVAGAGDGAEAEARRAAAEARGREALTAVMSLDASLPPRRALQLLMSSGPPSGAPAAAAAAAAGGGGGGGGGEGEGCGRGAEPWVPPLPEGLAGWIDDWREL